MQEDRNTIITFIIITTLFILLLIAFIVFILFLYQRRQLAYQKKMETLKSDFEKTMLATQLEIKEQAFQHISREIHDNIGISLSAAKLNMSTINWKNVSLSRKKVKDSTGLISRAMDDLRQLSRTLHTDFIKEHGLMKALETEIKMIKKLNLFAIQFEVTGTPVHLENQQELVIFRIMQEALNNSMKHARAANIHVLLHYGNRRLDIKVEDDGKGFNRQTDQPAANGGMGLQNMVKRAMLINGTCVVNSEPGKGTLISLTIPY